MFKICSIASGSNGNCLFVQAGNEKMLFDCGLSGKEIAARMNNVGINIEDINRVFVSHEHSDHIRGIGVVARRHDIPIYINEKTKKACEEMIGKVENIRYTKLDENIEIKDGMIRFLKTSHDAIKPCGFVVEYGKKKVGIITDTGIVTESIKKELGELNAIFLESNYDPTMLHNGPYPAYLKKRIDGKEGHLSNEDAGCLVLESADSGTLRKVLLSHISENNNNPELALNTFKIIISQRKDLKDLDVEVNSRYNVGKVFDV